MPKRKVPDPKMDNIPLYPPVEGSSSETGTNGTKPTDDFRAGTREDSNFRVSSAGLNILIKLDTEGRIQSREHVLRRLQEALDKSPEVRGRLLGVDKAKGRGEITPAMIDPFLTGIGLVNTVLAMTVLKMDRTVAQAIIPYTESERELLSTVSADAANENLDKLPTWLLHLLQGGGPVSLVKLVLVLVQVHAQKVQLVRQMMSQQQASSASVV